MKLEVRWIFTVAEAELLIDLACFHFFGGFW
jgi:hypothetical protein